MANIIYGADISTETRLNMELELHEYLLKVTKNHSDKVLMIDAETSRGITCGQVLQASDRMAKFLHNLGIEKGVVVAIASENRFEFLPGLLATLRIGSVFTCVNPLYTTGELAHAFDISKPIAVMVTNRTYDKVNTIQKSSDYIKHVINLDVVDFLKESNIIDDDNEIRTSVPVSTSADPAATALILYSSGTTGLSKGVQLTHRSIICLMEAYRTENILPFPDGNTISGLLPMSHTYGLFCILSCFVLGHKYIMIGRYSEESFLRYIEKHKITTLYVVPSIVLFLSKSSLVDNYNLSSVKLISSGGGPIRKSVEETIKKRFNCDMIQNYGMTETTTMNLISLPSSKPGITGRLLPGMMAKIIDLETGYLLGPGEFGEYCIKGPLLMKQYCDTSATSGMVSFDDEGWLHSGDVAYYDQEHNFYIVDRVKELIKYKGYQVPPAEIEGLLLQLPDIESIGVVGVPDEEAGELPRAYVVKQTGAEITAEEIQEYVAENLAPFKKLRGGVIFVDELPKTVSGKVERKELKKWVK
ncbi:uncharacterized protein LOC135847162 [Planococcus citri]|uniref:uncharacterized protein LOC135847162 n=1 Tax=Planococcus citri TaxID=170843 RepID=UPI0031F9E4A5